MLNASTGGTWDVALNRDAARRIVPSPPSVVVMSTFSDSVPEVVVVYTGKSNDL